MISHLSVHLDHRPYRCAQCPKAFKRKHDLGVHMRKHAKFRDPLKAIIDEVELDLQVYR